MLLIFQWRARCLLVKAQLEADPGPLFVSVTQLRVRLRLIGSSREFSLVLGRRPNLPPSISTYVVLLTAESHDKLEDREKKRWQYPVILKSIPLAPLRATAKDNLTFENLPAVNRLTFM
jgi:hypothetical protein